MQDNLKIRRTAIISIISILIIVLISAFFIIQDAKKTATIEILVAPQSSTIRLNGRKYSNGRYKIEPGEYYVDVEKEGFDSKNQTIVIESGEIEYLSLYLEQSGDDNSWYEEHDDDAEIVGSIVFSQAEKAVLELAKENPILSELPIRVDYYDKKSNRVCYGIFSEIDDQYASFTIVINDYTGNNYDAALQYIRARGYSPEKYDIEYIDNSGSSEWGKAF